MSDQIRVSILVLNALLVLSRILLYLPGVLTEFKAGEPVLGLLWRNKAILQQNLGWTLRPGAV